MARQFNEIIWPIHVAVSFDDHDHRPRILVIFLSPMTAKFIHCLAANLGYFSIPLPFSEDVMNVMTNFRRTTDK